MHQIIVTDVVMLQVRFAILLVLLIYRFTYHLISSFIWLKKWLAILTVGENDTMQSKAEAKHCDEDTQVGDGETNTVATSNDGNTISQRFKFFNETDNSVYGPKGEERAQLVPYFL